MSDDNAGQCWPEQEAFRTWRAKHIPDVELEHGAVMALMEAVTAERLKMQKERDHLREASVVHKVTVCNDCPMHYLYDGISGYGEMCTHPAHTFASENGIEDLNAVPPDWCPLRKKPVRIGLELEAW